jgi:hypothetical protein
VAVIEQPIMPNMLTPCSGLTNGEKTRVLREKQKTRNDLISRVKNAKGKLLVTDQPHSKTHNFLSNLSEERFFQKNF